LAETCNVHLIAVEYRQWRGNSLAASSDAPSVKPPSILQNNEWRRQFDLRRSEQVDNENDCHCGIIRISSSVTLQMEVCETELAFKRSKTEILTMSKVDYFNPLRPSGNYVNHLLWQPVMLHFVFIGFAWFSLLTAIISFKSVKKLIDVMVKCGVLFEVRTEFLNNI
jgi:hypothetical protein